MSRSVPALVQKWREGKTLTPGELEWVMEELQAAKAEPITTSITDPDANRVTDLHDVVEFNLPMTVMKGAYELNNRAYQGLCRTEYHVYQMLVRMHQGDIQAFRELFESRGDVDGLKPHISWVAPTISYRVVERTTRGTMESGHVGECLKCVALKEGNRAAA